ncbi:MAG: DNA mismatch repair protein MutS [Alphaproteobacteria bacterium MarineAlpha2_Bin1]|nr:MAG: DNA mismatch repair protein MutS [Alphaproteobacteria bacterium MarineAlpha2_Bin1]|tara:strand:- start:513 stop:3170 length:2658 start_codon:yes stop_codon:yes gene_type:complete
MKNINISDIESSKATPMVAQYLSIKKNHLDCLLFFRMGDFYELFFEDAIEAAKILEITLTKRGSYNGQDIPMCGVPAHSSEIYLSKLIKNGSKVAICEQNKISDNKQTLGKQNLMKRDVVRIITPGTLTEDNILEPKNYNFLLSILYNSSLIGLSWIDISTGDFYSKKIQKTQLNSELQKIDPNEIILRCDEKEETELIAFIEDYSYSKIYNEISETDCFSKIKNALNISDSNNLDEFSKEEIIASGYLLDYIFRTQKGKLPNIRFLISKNKIKEMVIDHSTFKNLEILQSNSGFKGGSLLSVIDKTSTSSGGRLLKKYLSAPLYDVKKINQRLDVVEFFIKNKSLSENLKANMSLIPDMERILSRISLGRNTPRDLGSIRDTLICITDIKKILGDKKLPEELYNQIKDLVINQNLIEELKKSLNEILPINIRDGFVKTAYSVKLDEVRNLRDSAKKHIEELKNKYISITGISSLKIRHNNILGYFIEVTNKFAEIVLDNNLEGFENFFIHRQSMANTKRFTTLELGELEGKIASAAERAIKIETEIFDKISSLVLESSKILYINARAIAEIDLFLALSNSAEENEYTRPKIDNSKSFKILGGRHPVVEQIIRSNGDIFTPNNCNLSDENRLWLITGPNMAGKSTFLRQNAIITLLAQIGSFVPADFAHIGVVDKLFSRVGAGDDLARGRSTFMVEMTETAGILNQATSNSLVILDEIGRGTATYDGLSIAWSSVEHLHEINKSRTLFATHYHELTSLKDSLDNLKLYHLKVKEWDGEIIFLYSVEPGSADKSYGILVAKLAGLPKTVVTRSKEVLSVFEKREINEKRSSASSELPLFSISNQNNFDNKVQEIIQLIKNIEPDDCSPKEALEKIYELKAFLDFKN